MPIWQAGRACNLSSHELTDECSGVYKSFLGQVIGGQNGDMIP
jgi:hypothetical protein